MMPGWMVDAFFWLVFPVAVLEGIRVARSERKRQRRELATALGYGSLELVLLAMCAATASPLLLAGLIALRMLVLFVRERQVWGRAVIKTLLIGAALVLLAVVGDVASFVDSPTASIAEGWRVAIISLVGIACGATPAESCVGEVVDCEGAHVGALDSCDRYGCIPAYPSGMGAPDVDRAICVPATAESCTVACRRSAPPCPTGTVPEGDGFCYTDRCIPAAACE